MIIYIQWALATPEDWFAFDVTRDQQIRAAAKKAEPTGNETLDQQAGWINSANCQGIEFSGWDHTAIEVAGKGLLITSWQDDLEDWKGEKSGIQWNLQPPAFDPNIGQINTVQTRTVWATPGLAAEYPEGIEVLPWEQFVLPPANQTFHGIWVDDNKFKEHRDIRSIHGWREWI